LFGAAGAELQSILLSSLESIDALEQLAARADMPDRHSAAPSLEHYNPQKLVTHVTILPIHELPVGSPPVRATNPIIQNSPFTREEEPQGARAVSTVRQRTLKKELKRFQPAEKDKNRCRAASWPGFARSQPPPASQQPSRFIAALPGRTVSTVVS
jgi:hypothetical protein